MVGPSARRMRCPWRCTLIDTRSFRVRRRQRSSSSWQGRSPAQGRTFGSQFGRLVDELGIKLIPAHSPQAKGRVERLFGTLQDRLVKALREAEAASLEEANQVLKEYLPRYNERFTRAAAEAASAYGAWPEDRGPEEFFCFKYRRTAEGPTLGGQ